MYHSIFINGIVFSYHLSKNDTSYYDSCQNSGLCKIKPLIGKPCILFADSEDRNFKILDINSAGSSSKKKRKNQESSDNVELQNNDIHT